MRNSKRKNVLQFCRYANSARPTLEISAIKTPSEALQDRQGILKVSGPANFKLLKNEVLRTHEPVVAPIEALLPFPLENLLIVRIPGTQYVDGHSVKLETKLKAPEHGIPLLPGFIERHSCLSHPLAQAA